MEGASPKKSNVGLIVGTVAVVGICFCVVPAIALLLLPSTVVPSGASNERKAAASLRTLTTAQEVFRANDLDRNEINDYWTANVAGLYCIRDEDSGRAIAAVSDVGLASADLDADNAEAAKFDRYDRTLLSPAGPNGGYVVQALIRDADGKPYAQDTDGSGLKLRGVERFGFMAMPAAHADTGLYTFVVDESAAIHRRDFGTNTRPPAFGMPLTTFDGVTPMDYPKPGDLGGAWKPFD